MNDLVLFGKALSDSTRIRILAALRQSELCVCELSDALEMSQSTLSTHLQTVRQAGLVATRKDGKWVYYRLEPSQSTIVETAFAHYQATLTADKRLHRDAERLQERLAIREQGRCTLGFAQLDLMPSKQEVKK